MEKLFSPIQNVFSKSPFQMNPGWSSRCGEKLNEKKEPRHFAESQTDDGHLANSVK